MPEQKVTIPAAPGHLSAKAAKKWQSLYADAIAKAQNDYPGNVSAQRAAANKAANGLLAVPAPESAKDIAALEDWQVMTRGIRTVKDQGQVAYCVTADGRKYSFPV